MPKIKSHIEIYMENYKTHGFILTLQNPSELDLDELRKLLLLNDHDYYIFGFEGIHELSTKHPHIHFYIHYKNPRWRDALMKRFTKNHWNEAVKAPERMIKYCEGYKFVGEAYVLKEPLCGENIWFEEGIRPKNGAHKNTDAQDVMAAITRGDTVVELRERFPKFMMYHKQKVVEWIDDIRQLENITFWKVNMNPHVLYDYEHIPGVERKDAIIITNLADVTLYQDYKDIIYVMSEFDENTRAIPIWLMTNDIVFTYGYQRKQIKCRHFIFACPHKHIHALKDVVNLKSLQEDIDADV